MDPQWAQHNYGTADVLEKTAKSHGLLPPGVQGYNLYKICFPMLSYNVVMFLL
jgi:hypothetical protein